MERTCRSGPWPRTTVRMHVCAWLAIMYSLYTTASVASDDARAVGELHARVPEASANRAAAPQHTRLRAFSRPRPLYAIRSMGPGVPATFFVRGKPVPAPPDQEDAAEQASSPELEHSCISADLLLAEVYRVQHDENVSLPSPLGDDIARLNELIRNASVEDILEQSAPKSAARASRQRVVCTRKTSPMSTEEKLAWQNVRNPDDEHPLPDQNAKSLRIKADGQGHERTARFRSRSAGTKVRSRSQHSEGHDLSAGASDAHYRPRTYVSVSMASFDESSYAPVRMTRVGGSTSASFLGGTSASSQPPPYPPRESRRRHRGGLSSGHMVRSVSIGAAEPHADLRFGALHGQGEIGRRLAEEGEAPPSRFPGDHERAWALGGEPQRFGSRMLPGTFSAPRLRLFAACMHACVHVRIHVFYICMHACMHACIYVCVYLCVHACMHLRKYVHTFHAHTHTHTHTQASFQCRKSRRGFSGLETKHHPQPKVNCLQAPPLALTRHPDARAEHGLHPTPISIALGTPPSSHQQRLDQRLNREAVAPGMCNRRRRRLRARARSWLPRGRHGCNRRHGHRQRRWRASVSEGPPVGPRLPHQCGRLWAGSESGRGGKHPLLRQAAAAATAATLRR